VFAHQPIRFSILREISSTFHHPEGVSHGQSA
jgi:hypothetical protein